MPCAVENPKSSAHQNFHLRGRQPTGGAVTKIHVHALTKPLTGTINPRPADANIELQRHRLDHGNFTANYSIPVRNAG
jgi:hypothetical protein